MLDKLKQMKELKKMRDEAMRIQKELSKIEVVGSKGDVEVKMSGDMKVVEVLIDGEEDRDIKDAMNDALKRAQKKSAQMMQQMGGLGGLMGGS